MSRPAKPQPIFPIMDKIGGPQRTLDVVKHKTNVRILKALEGWGRRGQIPGNAMVVMMEHCDTLGIRYSAKDFMPVWPVVSDKAA